MIEDVYKTKYLKYKQKYLDLKKIEQKLIINGGKLNKLEQQINMNGGKLKKELILFKADWCGHCQKLKPVWEQLKKEYTDISYVEYDADINNSIIKDNNIKGYPTIKYNNGRTIVEYNGSRDINSFINYLKSN
jgi:thiol-disulfide isomerase/thioredoxin